MYIELDFGDHGLSGMSDEHSKDGKNEVSKPRRKPEIAPVSDSQLTAVQREARELYKPNVRAPRTSMESAEHAALRQGDDAATVRNHLIEASVGVQRINQTLAEIQRSFAGGGNRYVLGAEFAIVAIVAIAGIAKRRADLSDAHIKAITGSGDDSQVEVVYQSPKLKEKLKSKKLPGDKKDNDGLKNLLERKKNPEDGQKRVLPSGFNKGVPDWMISLDSSVAKESGYLFNSVLRRPTVLMTMSDTFVSLGEQHFFDALLAWLIVDLNKHKVTEMWKGTTKVVAISNGETIELPVWEDIVEFYQNKPKVAKADNLLTVVLKRSLDRELIEAALASVVVPGHANVVSDGKVVGMIDGAAGVVPFMLGDPDYGAFRLQEFRVTIGGAEVRIFRFFYENFNNWKLMKSYIRSRRSIGRNL
jgi:hypothetical protein